MSPAISAPIGPQFPSRDDQRLATPGSLARKQRLRDTLVRSERSLLIVPDLGKISVEKKQPPNNLEDYFQFDLPRPRLGLDNWELFMDSEGKKVWAKSPSEAEKEGFQIGTLHLCLGYRDNIRRNNNKLTKVYLKKKYEA